MVIVVLVATIALAGCKKDKETTEQAIPKGLLCFKTNEEFSDTYQKVLAMSEAERREWEKQQGFKSYATKCNELFEAFEAKGINSDQDIYNFVKENSDYFYIREEDGEKYLSSHLEDSPYRVLANESQLFIINTQLFKLLKDGIVKTCFSNYDIIKEVTSITEILQIEEIEVLPTNSCKSIVKKQFRETNGDERTLAEVYIDYSPITGGWEVTYLIRPYKRTLGVWYWARRTITGEMNTNWRYKKYDGDKWWTGSTEPFHLTTGVLSYCIETRIGDLGYRNYSLNTAEFTKIDGWADTPSTDVCYCKLN